MGQALVGTGLVDWGIVGPWALMDWDVVALVGLPGSIWPGTGIHFYGRLPRTNLRLTNIY